MSEATNCTTTGYSGVPWHKAAQSYQLDELSKAMVQVQSEINGVGKGTKAYNYMYADLHACIEACKPSLTKHGLCIIQTHELGEKGNVIVTTLLHKSGQWMRGKTYVPAAKNDAQSIGSALTYARRYAYSAIVGLAQKDDDGDAAMPKAQPPQKKRQLNNVKKTNHTHIDNPIVQAANQPTPKLDAVIDKLEAAGLHVKASKDITNHAPATKQNLPGDNISLYMFKGKALADHDRDKLLAWGKWAIKEDMPENSVSWQDRDVVLKYLNEFNPHEEIPF